jgi:predicted metalloprotease with PDZ domain
LIEYRISCADVYRHHFSIECRIWDARDVEELFLPSWIPGSYLLREYARHVVAVEASADAGPVVIEKVNKNTWRFSGVRGELCVRATVYALDRSVRGSYLDVTRGYFNGVCVFLCPIGRENESIELVIERPVDAACAAWRVATAMRSTAVDDAGFGRYVAAGYDELIDHPVEMSDHKSVTFEAGRKPHRFVVAGLCDADLERLATDLKQLCETQIAFFDGDAPFDQYCFLGVAVDQGYGGLEHRASSSLMFDRGDLPRRGELAIPAPYQRLLALVSHEYFHTWHVKRSKPDAFVPYRLSERNHTRQLWVFEGITSYYQELFLLRSHLLNAQAFLRRMGELLTRVYRAPGRKVQSLAAASFDAWDVFYKPDANSPNATTSYYSKGALVALALDLELRERTDSSVSLDTIIRELWRRYGKDGQGVPERGFEALACELVGAELERFFETSVRETDDPPIEALLARFGVTLKRRAALGPDDKGGTPPREGTDAVWLGADWRGAPTGLELTTVFDGGPAQAGGLNPGDLLIAINRLQVSAATIAQRLGRFEAGEHVLATVLRDGELLGFTLALQAPPQVCCYLVLADDCEAAARVRRQAWLGL